MSKVLNSLPTVARILLGSVFLLFGVNGFLGFLPMPPFPGPAGELMGALAATGYLFPLLATTEIVAGALLLAGRFVPLALALLAPVLVNVVAFHVVLAPATLGMPIFLLMLEVYLAWAHRDAFAAMLRSRTASAFPDPPRYARAGRVLSLSPLRPEAHSFA